MTANKIKINLLELQEIVKESVEGSFAGHLWLCAEIGEITNNTTGHCYMTLVEKDDSGNGIAARAQAIIWASSYRAIKPYFETFAGTSLSVGMHILVKVQVQYSPVYGMSLIVYDIDPAFTVGEFELQRRKTIKRLQDEGVVGMNSSLPFPSLPKRLAIISSDTAAGYGDFIRHLSENEYGYCFSTQLFPAPMQGKDAQAGIISALDKIASCCDNFDVVLILRGGGSSLDLSCFDDYEIALNIAQFPLPVLTAIGHDRDYHVADMVAFLSVKTPTALADYIIDLYIKEEYHVSSLASRLLIALKEKKNDTASILEDLKSKIKIAVSGKVLSEVKKIDRYEYAVNMLNPLNLLDKGFAIPIKEGKKQDSVKNLDRGDKITLIFRDGTAECEILSKKVYEK